MMRSRTSVFESAEESFFKLFPLRLHGDLNLDVQRSKRIWIITSNLQNNIEILLPFGGYYTVDAARDKTYIAVVQLYIDLAFDQDI